MENAFTKNDTAPPMIATTTTAITTYRIQPRLPPPVDVVVGGGYGVPYGWYCGAV